MVGTSDKNFDNFDNVFTARFFGSPKVLVRHLTAQDLKWPKEPISKVLKDTERSLFSKSLIRWRYNSFPNLYFLAAWMASLELV